MLCSRFLKLSRNQQGRKHQGHGRLPLLVPCPTAGCCAGRCATAGSSSLSAFVVMLSTVPLFMSVGKNFLPHGRPERIRSHRAHARRLVRSKAPPRSWPSSRSDLKTAARASRNLLDHPRRRPAQAGRPRLHPGRTRGRQAARQSRRPQLMLMARERLAKFRDLTIGVQLPAIIQGGGSTANCSSTCRAPTCSKLDKYAQQVKAKLAKIPGVTDLDSSYEPASPNFACIINRDKAADLNVNVASIANAMRMLVGGDDQVTTYREGDDRYDVQLRVQKEFRDSPAALERLYVPSATLGNVPVSNVARSGPGHRPHADRALQPPAPDPDHRQPGQGPGAQQRHHRVADQPIDGLNMPPEYRLRPGRPVARNSAAPPRTSCSPSCSRSFSCTWCWRRSSRASSIRSRSCSACRSRCRSRCCRLLLMRENFSIIYTSLGILVLFGIVKKNSILQIDHIKALRREGHVAYRRHSTRAAMDRLAAHSDDHRRAGGGHDPAGARRRARARARGARWPSWSSAARSLCLLLTLLVTPVTYSLFDDLAHSTVWARVGAFFSRGGLQLRRAWTGVTGLIR